MTARSPSFCENEDYELLEPEIAQVFLIGDGEGRTITVPDDATRLFLGFADAASFVGQPGYYGNNSGAIAVRVMISGEGG
jgi:hypothetical protein